jgi:hypothetical protein
VQTLVEYQIGTHRHGFGDSRRERVGNKARTRAASTDRSETGRKVGGNLQVSSSQSWKSRNCRCCCGRRQRCCIRLGSGQLFVQNHDVHGLLTAWLVSTAVVVVVVNLFDSQLYLALRKLDAHSAAISVEECLKVNENPPGGRAARSTHSDSYAASR